VSSFLAASRATRAAASSSAACQGRRGPGSVVVKAQGLGYEVGDVGIMFRV
jgi:hypothetical protein